MTGRTFQPRKSRPPKRPEGASQFLRLVPSPGSAGVLARIRRRLAGGMLRLSRRVDHQSAISFDSPDKEHSFLLAPMSQRKPKPKTPAKPQKPGKALPSGVVTALFTDLVSSTQLKGKMEEQRPPAAIPPTGKASKRRMMRLCCR